LSLSSFVFKNGFYYLAQYYKQFARTAASNEEAANVGPEMLIIYKIVYTSNLRHQFVDDATYKEQKLLLSYMK
jgi:hypothetical protein